MLHHHYLNARSFGCAPYHTLTWYTTIDPEKRGVFVWWLYQSMPNFHNNDIFVNERYHNPQIISHREIWHHACLNRDSNITDFQREY